MPTQIIKSNPDAIYNAFVDPDQLSKYWLHSASGPLALDQEITWRFRVPDARETTIATALEPGKLISWRWKDGTTVDISITPRDHECVVRIELEPASADAVEGFTIVLCDLKLFLETGRSPGLVDDKARLIASATQ